MRYRPFERAVSKRVTEAARRRLLRCPRQLRHDRPKFTVGRSYELTFFTGSSKATASLKVTVLDISLPLIMVRDGKGVEIVINTSSAGFVSAKAMKGQGERWWRIARRRQSLDAGRPAGAVMPEGPDEPTTGAPSTEIPSARLGENEKP